MSQTGITIGVPRETAEGERRVALVPDAVAKLRARGLEVVVEPGAGAAALIPDDLYLAAGAAFDRDPWGCDIVVKVAPPTLEEVTRLREGAVLIGFLTPWAAPDMHAALNARGVSAFAMEAIPWISRAQAMDALFSQSTIAGYKAVVVYARNLRALLELMLADGDGEQRLDLSDEILAEARVTPIERAVS